MALEDFIGRIILCMKQARWGLSLDSKKDREDSTIALSEILYALGEKCRELAEKINPSFGESYKVKP